MSSEDGLSRRGFFNKIRGAVSPKPAEEAEEVAEVESPEPAPFDLAGMLARLEGGQEAKFEAPVIPVLRPPGALPEPAFLAACTRCRDCVAACPHGAIVLAPARFREAAGTPMLDPLRAPCRMCSDTPCISACGPGALRLGGEDGPFHMGIARIKTSDCLAYQGSFCSVCAERCPVPEAIVVEVGRPRIQPQLCTGCGICHHVCPSPWNAILVMPEIQRK